MNYLRLNALTVPADDAPREIDMLLAPRIAAALGVPESAVAEYRILRRSIDARRGGVKLLYKLDAALNRPVPALPGTETLTGFEQEPDSPPAPFRAGRAPHVAVVGAGPGGLFAALELAAAGARVTLLDRGFDAEKRTADYARFLTTRKLDPESNLLYGEGGAGTFSDGKLYTRIGDALCRKVLRSFVAAGAPENILYLQRPHLGSDKLPGIVGTLRRQLESAGGIVRFGCRVEDIVGENGRCTGARLASGETLAADAVLIACGLGGRDLIRTLAARGVAHRLKGFQLGCRIVHPQTLVNRRQYRRDVPPRCLGAAEYNLVAHPADGASVSSFCMCPGGTVVNASAWPGRSLSNGMSRAGRDGKFANSALIVTLDPAQFSDADAAYRFLEECERAAFAAGGGDYRLPAQSARGFLAGREELIYPENDCGVDCGVKSARLDRVLPPLLVRSLRGALREFERKIPGFVRDGQFAGVESCVSSPVAFECTPDGASSMPGLFLCGEGAGRAGGIVSAAVDGLRCARGIVETLR